MSSTLSYGLGAGGFVRMRMPEIRRAIFDDLKIRTGQTFDETPDSLSGQFVSIFAEREAAIWELAEAVWLAAYPATATGVSLDLAVSFAGVTRIQPSRTTARVILFGTQGTLVEVGSIVQSTYLAPGEAAGQQFALVSDALITRDVAANVLLTVPATVVVGTFYSVVYNGLTASVTAASGDAAADIATVLAAALTAIGASVSVAGSAFRITSAGSFSVTWSDSLTLSALGSPATVEATTDGVIEAPAGSTTRIIDSTTGWASVQQPADAVPGTLLETDEDLRARYTTGVYRLGAATVPSIKANIQQAIRGLTSVSVYENVTGTTDADGRPAHSVEAVVEDGDEDAIAALIYRIKPAGIQSYGNVTVPVPDETGHLHQISFSRPQSIRVWLKAVLTTTSEETVPGNVAARAAAAMVAAANMLQAGEDVHLQRIAAAVFPATTGVAAVTLTAATGNSEPDPGDYSASDIVIGPRQRAKFFIDRTTVS
jgi:uncharacterized phage protein gp47/JayE